MKPEASRLDDTTLQLSQLHSCANLSFSLHAILAINATTDELWSQQKQAIFRIHLNQLKHETARVWKPSVVYKANNLATSNFGYCDVLKKR